MEVIRAPVAIVGDGPAGLAAAAISLPENYAGLPYGA